MRTLASIRSELLRLKWHVAAIRFEIAMRRHALALKAGFNPDQPRIPAGGPHGGQWTSGAAGGGAIFIRFPLADAEAAEPGFDDAGAFDDFDAYDESGTFDEPATFGDGDPTDFSDGRRRLPLPPIESLLDIPSARPETTQEINRIAREVSRNPYLAPYYFVTIAESVGHWLNEKYWEIRADQDPPKSLEELQDAVFGSDKKGYDDHHIVGRWAGRDGLFSQSRINEGDNVVRIPRYKHWDINRWYETPNGEFGRLTPRQYLNESRNWREHREIGLKALRERGVLAP
jgi:hypothetical protein